MKFGKLLICLPCLMAWVSASAQTPIINPQGLVNAATGRSSFSAPVVAQGSIVSIFGNNFSSITGSADGIPIPIQLPGTGTQVLFGGIAAPLFFVSPTRIDAQVPFELRESSSVDLVVRNENGTSAPLKVIVLIQDPGIFSVLRMGSQIGTSNPILPGDTISIFATGLGPVSPPVPSGQPGQPTR